MDSCFLADVRANGYPSALRKKYWVLLSIRKEQAGGAVFTRRLWALAKKALLAGTGCEMPAVAFTGEGLRIPHLNGIIVSDSARMGANCTVFHQVTIGISGVPGKDGAPRIGDGVMIGAGSKILGPVQIGDHVRIGANSVVTKDVPSGATVVGVNKICKA